jgi:hypothetical protein
MTGVSKQAAMELVVTDNTEHYNLECNNEMYRAAENPELKHSDCITHTGSQLKLS